MFNIHSKDHITDKFIKFFLSDHEDTTDLLTHMMPFPGYGIRHTCGPNPNVCGQFDFRKLQPPSPWYATWPWSVIPVAITMGNIAER